MRNHSFYELFKLSKYQEFNIRGSDSGLYLSLAEKRLDASSILEVPEYALFELEDIHVSVLEQYEISRKRADRSYKSSSPFHITLRFREQDSGRAIVVHDFYSTLDLSRDFHVQLKDGETLTYLPQQTINLSKLNQLIEKEMRLVKELIEKNNKHEQDLRQSIDLAYDDLFSRAQQANHFPETMDDSEYHHFHQSLTQIIAHLEQLIYLGHHYESRRLAHAQREFDHLTKSMQSAPQAAQKGQAAAEEKALTKASKANSQKSTSKKGLSPKQKNDSQVQLTAFLNAYYTEVQALKARKYAFLEDINRCMLPEPKFDPQALLAHLNAHFDILTELTNAELEHVTIEFFEQFSICRDPVKQTICLEIAEFLSLHVASLSNYILKLSLMSYAFSDARISLILMALLKNNVPYWTFMHSYGINFADNRHIIVNGIAGNILHGILYLIKDINAETVDSIIPFVELLFRYLEEDGMTLRNMKTITAIMTENRKKVSTQAFFQKQKSRSAAESATLIEQFIKNIHEEPYGTVLIMDALELWLIRAKEHRMEGVGTEPRVDRLLPIMVELLILLMPQITTSALVITFQRLLALQVLGMFDDHSCHMLITNADLPPLDRLSQFSLIYVGFDYDEPISKLLDVLVMSLTDRISTTSNSALSQLMKDYYTQSKTGVCTASISKSMIQKATNTTAKCQPIFQINHKLTFARIAYFLFTIKAKRGMFLTLEDYCVLLNFYQLYLSAEMIRFSKDEPEYNHQRRVSLNILEIIASAMTELNLPEAIQIPLFASSDFLALLADYQELKDEAGQEQAEQKTMGFGVS